MFDGQSVFSKVYFSVALGIRGKRGAKDKTKYFVDRIQSDERVQELRIQDRMRKEG